MEFVCFKCGATYQAPTQFCWGCMKGGFISAKWKPAASSLNQEMEVASTEDIIKRQFGSMAVPSYPGIAVGPNCLVMVHGPPGGGKSTMATMWVKGTRAVYLSAEEGLSATLGNRVRRCNLSRNETIMWISRCSVDGLLQVVEEFRARWLVIDSIPMTSFRPDHLRLIATNKVRGLVAVQQSTKAGDAAGSQAFLHEADVVIRVEHGKWTIEKSRFQSCGVSGPVLDPEENRDDGVLHVLPPTHSPSESDEKGHTDAVLR